MWFRLKALRLCKLVHVLADVAEFRLHCVANTQRPIGAPGPPSRQSSTPHAGYCDQDRRAGFVAEVLRGGAGKRGTVLSVTEQEMADAESSHRTRGSRCEPASASTVAGIRRLVADGVIGADEDVVAVLTGHVLKIPTTSSNTPGKPIQRWRRDRRSAARSQAHIATRQPWLRLQGSNS